MLEHTKYEEFCALATVGLISAEEFAELQTHLKECSLCAGLHKDLLDINSIWLTQAQELEPEMYIQHSALRRKILGTLQDGGAQFSEPIRNQIAPPSNRFGLFAVIRTPTTIWAAAAAIFLVAAFLGFEVGIY